MKETIALEDPRISIGLPKDVCEGFHDTQSRIETRSMIIWGEHCSECAAMACYLSCSFYSPRMDGNCRRFLNGIETVQDTQLAASSATRIVFRQWGKLEGRGPSKPFLSAAAKEREARFDKASRAFQLPFLARRSAWKQTESDRQTSSGPALGFDAFVVEGFSPNGADVPFTLTIVPADKSTPALFQAKFIFGNKWSRHEFPFHEIVRQIDVKKDHLIQIEPIGEASGIEAIFGLVDFVSWSKDKTPSTHGEAPKPAKFAKVVVWDLDHTIWDGILLEDGAQGVTIRPGVREVMVQLDERGVLQSVASKNNLEDALAALEHHGLSDLILAPQVGWGPKSDALKRLAQILNLGLDSFVFIDDQPFERGEVGEALPNVTILDENCISQLLDRAQFDLPVTPESKGRRALYAVEAQRVLAAGDAGSDYDAFLRSCNLQLTIMPLSEVDVERVYELSQRTNQLNVAATRYSREEVASLISGSVSQKGWTMRCRDRFGDYGLIGFALFDAKEGNLLDFFMSCRVQRKRVEAAFFNWMAKQMNEAGAARICVRWRKAARNGPAVEMFEALGFILQKDSDQTGHLICKVDAAFEGANIVTINQSIANQVNVS
jgi:FkbH-like protein